MIAPSIGVLVSLGRHPESGRGRRAQLDARAVELALRMAPSDCVELIHAGAPSEAVLRDYLGMGAPRMIVLDVPPHSDPFDALVSYLRFRNFALLLTGGRAEVGGGSGLLPYSLAQRLGSAVIASVSGIGFARDGDHAVKVEQALEGGMVRRLRVTLPAVVAVGMAAPAPRQCAFARAKRGQLQILPVDPSGLRPHRRAATQSVAGRAKTLKPGLAGLLPDDDHKKTNVAGRILLDHPTPEDAAATILDFLRARGLCHRP